MMLELKRVILFFSSVADTASSNAYSQKLANTAYGFASSRQNLPLRASFSACAPTGSVLNNAAEGFQCLPGGKGALTAAEIGQRSRRQPAAISEDVGETDLLYLDCSQTSELKGLSRKMIFHLSAILSIHYAEYFRSRGRQMTLMRNRGLPRRPVDANQTRNVSDGRLSSKSSCQLQRFGQKTQPFSIKN